MKQTTLLGKIIYIKKVLGTPYHFFHFTKDGMILIIFENKEGKRYSFREYTMFKAVLGAEEYVENEIKAGALEELKKDKKENNKDVPKDDKEATTN